MERLTINLGEDSVLVAGRQLAARIDVPEYDTRIGVVAGGGGGGLDQEAADLRYVNSDGDVMAGPLVVPVPTAAGHAANKGYVDARPTGITQAAADNRYLMLDGGIVEGNLTVMGELVAGAQLVASEVAVAGSIEVPDPTAPDHAANKRYADARTPPVLVLNATAPVPGGTAAGTVIVRRSA